MSLNVQTYSEECDEELGREIQADLRYVKSKTGIDVSRAELESPAEMGDAAGTCVIATKEINFRADTVAANNAEHFRARRHKTGSFRHVARHEAEHATGNRLEGTTEWVVTKELGVDPVPAYRQKTRATQLMIDLLGEAETLEMARQENAEVLLFAALVLKKVSQHIPLQRAAKESEKLVRSAA